MKRWKDYLKQRKGVVIFMKELMTIIRMTEKDHFSGNVVSRIQSFKNHKKAIMYILDFIYSYDAVINGVLWMRTG